MKEFDTLGELLAFLQDIEDNQGSDLPVRITTDDDPRTLTTIGDISLVDSARHGLYLHIEV